MTVYLWSGVVVVVTPWSGIRFARPDLLSFVLTICVRVPRAHNLVGRGYLPWVSPDGSDLEARLVGLPLSLGWLHVNREMGFIRVIPYFLSCSELPSYKCPLLLGSQGLL